MTREELEKEATRVISSELYYDFVNVIDQIEDEELQRLINCGGNFYREIKDNPTFDDITKMEALAAHGE